jgi:predicted dithiol-disulfide oxidoreductase (DUF899 family)
VGPVDRGPTPEGYVAGRPGLSALGFYPLLDRVPKERDAGGSTEFWIRRHDEYQPEHVG